MTADQGFYSRHVLPHLVHLACSLKPIRRQREKVVPLARGRVVEIGVGSGLNLAYYHVERGMGTEVRRTETRLLIAVCAALALSTPAFAQGELHKGTGVNKSVSKGFPEARRWSSCNRTSNS